MFVSNILLILLEGRKRNQTKIKGKRVSKFTQRKFVHLNSNENKESNPKVRFE